jgi:hypothetical protein
MSLKSVHTTVMTVARAKQEYYKQFPDRVVFWTDLHVTPFNHTTMPTVPTPFTYQLLPKLRRFYCSVRTKCCPPLPTQSTAQNDISAHHNYLQYKSIDCTNQTPPIYVRTTHSSVPLVSSYDTCNIWRWSLQAETSCQPICHVHTQ